MSGFDPVQPHPRWRSTTARSNSAGMDNAQLEMGYQPVVDLLTSGVVALESEVQWRRPHAAPLQGEALRLFAESYGFVDRIGDVAARRVVAELAQCRDRGFDVPATLSVSALQVTSPGFAAWLLDELRSAEVPARRLTVEVSESSLAAHPSMARSTLCALRAAGLGVQLNGAADASGLELMLRLAPITGIKVDQFLVSQLGASGVAEETLVGLLTLAESLHVDAVVAGVATTAQLRLLRRLGCRRVMGPLWGPARSLEQALRLHGVPRPRTVT